MTEKPPEISERANMFSENARWAANLATRWANLKKDKPNIWEREKAANRQLMAGMNEVKMYAGDEFRSVPYTMAKNNFQAMVKENLKKMGFGQ